MNSCRWRAARGARDFSGYVSYIPRSRCENFDYDTGILYLETLDKPCEEAKIKLLPAIGRLLKKEVTVETEARTLSECSMPRRSLRSVTAIKDVKERVRVRRILGDIWSDEMELEPNVALARLFAEEGEPDALKCAELLKKTERNYLQALLKIKRFANRLPEQYRFSHMEKIDEAVNEIDGSEDKIHQIKLTEETEM